jgi:PST family polysaccharide transporter
MVTVGTRCIAAVLVIFAVDGPDKYILIPLIIGSTYLVGAVYASIHSFVNYRLEFKWPSMSFLIKILRDGQFIFMGNLGIALYRGANVLVLAAIGASTSAIAAYSLAEKLVKALQAIIRPLNQHTFPKALQIAQDENKSAKKILTELFWLTFPQIIVLALFFTALCASVPFAKIHFAKISSVENIDLVVLLIKMMSLGALVGVANFMLGSAGLNAMGERRYLFKAIIGAGIAGVVTCAIAGKLWGAYGAAGAFIFAEVFLQGAILRRYFRSATREYLWT